MKISKSQLKRIIREEHSKLIKETGMYNKYSSRRAPIATYGQQIQDSMRSNQLPPPSSNWYGFAKALDIGVMDLDDLARDLGYKSFPQMDASISPRGLSDTEAEDVVEIIYGINGADEISVYDALEAPYSP